MAISRSEIKKCGFKPVEDHKAKFKAYTRKIPNGLAYLQHLNEKTGEVRILTDVETNPTSKRRRLISRFQGTLPARYELQIILRCTGIA
jgi:hypothetical protein